MGLADAAGAHSPSHAIANLHTLMCIHFDSRDISLFPGYQIQRKEIACPLRGGGAGPQAESTMGTWSACKATE